MSITMLFKCSEKIRNIPSILTRQNYGKHKHNMLWFSHVIIL